MNVPAETKTDSIPMLFVMNSGMWHPFSWFGAAMADGYN
jgi:hypothetical protein